MQRPMYIRYWLDVDLTELPAARNQHGKLAGPDVYAQFYEALAAGMGKVDPQWVHTKRSEGRAIAQSILEPWRRRHGRSPRILSLGAGMGIAESLWLEGGLNVVLQDCQERSLRDIAAKFPNARTLIGDVREIAIAGRYDIVSMLALEYVMSRADLKLLFRKIAGCLAGEGLLLLQSVSTLSVRQWLAEMVKANSGRHENRLLWGWWRTPAEYLRIARGTGLALAAGYSFSESSGRKVVLQPRSSFSCRWPPVRSNNTLMIFRSSSEENKS